MCKPFCRIQQVAVWLIILQTQCELHVRCHSSKPCQDHRIQFGIKPGCPGCTSAWLGLNYSTRRTPSHRAQTQLLWPGTKHATVCTQLFQNGWTPRSARQLAQERRSSSRHSSRCRRGRGMSGSSIPTGHHPEGGCSTRHHTVPLKLAFLGCTPTIASLGPKVHMPRKIIMIDRQTSLKSPSWPRPAQIS